jgi:enoyl-CoA hydratase
MSNPVLFKVENHIAVMTLNRPERRNAINQALLMALYDALDEVNTSHTIRVGIITGAGKSFCSGLDLEALSTDNLFDPRGDGKDFPNVIDACPKPIIGAINGHAITGGLEIALRCDFLIASERASFADTHTKVGIHPGWGMTPLPQEAIGIRRAKQMSFTCRLINAETAFK